MLNVSRAATVHVRTARTQLSLKCIQHFTTSAFLSLLGVFLPGAPKESAQFPYIGNLHFRNFHVFVISQFL